MQPNDIHGRSPSAWLGRHGGGSAQSTLHDTSARCAALSARKPPQPPGPPAWALGSSDASTGWCAAWPLPKFSAERNACHTRRWWSCGGPEEGAALPSTATSRWRSVSAVALALGDMQTYTAARVSAGSVGPTPVPPTRVWIASSSQRNTSPASTWAVMAPALCATMPVGTVRTQVRSGSLLTRRPLGAAPPRSRRSFGRPAGGPAWRGTAPVRGSGGATEG